jgi:hypothetical protein
MQNRGVIGCPISSCADGAIFFRVWKKKIGTGNLTIPFFPDASHCSKMMYLIH